MRTDRITSIGLAFLLVAMSAATGLGATRVSQSFDGLSAPDGAGRLVTVRGLRAWKAGIDPAEPAAPRYLSYPSASALASTSGTIEIELVRGDRSSETLFKLRDAADSVTMRAQLFWTPFFGNPYPSIVFEAKGEELGIWNLVPFDEAVARGDKPDPYPPHPWPVVYFDKPVTVGSTIHLAFTWGPDANDCAVYLDGVKLHSLTFDPATMQRIVAAASELVVGADFSTKYPLDTRDDLASLIIGVRTSDEPLAPAQFLRSPTILAVGHNASRVAGYSGFLVEGQELTITLEAETGGKASCDIGDIHDIPLAEQKDRPGTYAGIYTVKAGDFVDKGALTGRFRNLIGIEAAPFVAQRAVSIDGRVHLAVKSSNELVPADKKSKVGVTVVASDANGKKLRNHPVKITLSTTDEYTGLVGSGQFADEVGGALVTDWGGVSDSFGEVTAQYQSGFAAKTVMVNAKDMLTGDVGFGAIRSFIEGKVDVTVREPAVSRLLASRGTLELSASRPWLTADGSSRSRITARVLGLDGRPVQGDQVSFTLTGDRGQIRVVQARTDSSGRAYADYIAGTVIGQVQVEVRDLTMGLVASLPIELRSDAPAEIILKAELPEVMIGGKPTAILAKVTDVNGNPNSDTEVQFALASGEGTLSAASARTDAKAGNASISFTAGSKAGVATIRATVMSRLPNASELSAAAGAVFLYGVASDPGELTVKEWKAEAKDEVIEGQELAVLEDRRGNLFTVKAPRDGILSVIGVEKGEAARLGDTLAYVLLAGE